MFSLQMLMITGEAKYPDLVVRTLYNREPGTMRIWMPTA
jgi:hypothetical protein